MQDHALVLAIPVVVPGVRCLEYPTPLLASDKSMLGSHEMSHSQQVLDRTVRIEEGSAHGGVNVGPSEPHILHVGNGSIAFAAHRQRRRIVELRGIGG
jgi:hypothetical protein